MSVRCGNRKVHTAPEANGHHHETSAQVLLCFKRPNGIPSIEDEQAAAADEWIAQADYEAEQRNERWFENGGDMADIIWHENEQERLREQFYFA